MKQPELGKYIASLREAKGLTQEELVSNCNISVRTLQRIESGKVMPRSYTLKAIATVLNCNLFTVSDTIENHKVDSASVSVLKRIHNYLNDLFNLKTQKMKKVSILSTAVLTVGFSLYTIGAKCQAQLVEREAKYVMDNSRGFEIRLPQGLSGYGSYITNDTLYVRAGQDIIKEYKGFLYLNNKKVGSVNMGDTVIFKKGTFIKKKSLLIGPYIVKPSFVNNGIIYVTPYPLETVISDGGGNIFLVDRYKIREQDNKVFLDDIYQGDAFTGDTVIFRYGKLVIRHVPHDLGLN